MTPRWLKIIGLTLGTLVVTAVAGEVWLRRRMTRIVDTALPDNQTLSDPEALITYTGRGRRWRARSHVKIIHHSTSRLDVDMRINSLGLRGPEITVPKPAGTYRILFLGDSITAADYLPEVDTFVHQVQLRMPPPRPGGRVETINGGIGDIGIREEMDILEDVGLKLQPDLVVLCFYLNDSRPPLGFPRELGHLTWLRRYSALYETLYRSVQLQRWVEKYGVDRFRWIQDMKKLPWARDRNAFLALARSAEYDWGAAWNPDSWRVIEQQLQRLEHHSKAAKFKVLVVAFPVLFQVYAHFEEASPQGILAKSVDVHGFRYFDLLPLFRSLKKQTWMYDMCHPTLEANRIIAQAIASEIQRFY